MSVSLGGFSTEGNSIAALGNANVRVQGPQLETVLSLVLGRYTLISFIDALQSQELSDVQAAPVVTTLDNQEAEIWVGERTPIRVVDLASGAAAGSGGATVTAPRATAELVETGIRLRSGKELEADIVVSATGLELLFLGGIELAVDGEPVELKDRLTYKGMMLEGVPNLALAIGYTNASWTLRCDLTCRYVTRLLNRLRASGLRQCTPVNDDPAT